eukprot:538130_1
MLPTHRQQELLSFGYIRFKCKRYHIPIPVTKMMLAYYNDINILIFKDKLLKTFLDNKSSQLPHITPFKPFCIHGIRFESMIKTTPDPYPSKFVTFVLHITSRCAINKIILYLELYCFETNTYIKGTKTFLLKGEKTKEWSLPWVKTSKCKPKKVLHFGMYIHIKQIHYTNVNNFAPPITLYERIKIQRNGSFEWQMTNKLLAEIKSVNIDGTHRYYSPNFGGYNSWYIRFRPDKNNTYFRLLHRSFPQNIKQIELVYSVVLICDGKSYYIDRQQIFTRNDNGMELCFIGVNWMDIVGSQSICMLIKFNIIKADNCNNKQIEGKDFSNYGIVWSW